MSDIQPTEKVCTCCGLPKLLAEFSADKQGKYGKSAACKLCRREKSSIYYAENKEAVKAAVRKYVAANKEAVSDRNAARRLANRDEINTKTAAWRLANKEKVKAQAAKHYRENKKKHAEWCATYFQANKERIRAYKLEWVHANKDVLAPKKLAYRLANKESIRDKAKAHRQANKEALKAVSRAYYAANKETLKAKISAYLATPAGRAVHRRAHAKRQAMKAGVPIGDLDAIDAWEATWRDADSVCCFWCERMFPGNKCQADHVIPFVLRGPHCVANLVIACQKCNATKSGSHPRDFNPIRYAVWCSAQTGTSR